jgi:hypothetical protein
MRFFAWIGGFLLKHRQRREKVFTWDYVGYWEYTLITGKTVGIDPDDALYQITEHMRRKYGDDTDILFRVISLVREARACRA